MKRNEKNREWNQSKTYINRLHQRSDLFGCPNRRVQQSDSARSWIVDVDVNRISRCYLTSLSLGRELSLRIRVWNHSILWKWTIQKWHPVDGIRQTNNLSRRPLQASRKSMFPLPLCQSSCRASSLVLVNNSVSYIVRNRAWSLLDSCCREHIS